MTSPARLNAHASEPPDVRDTPCEGHGIRWSAVEADLTRAHLAARLKRRHITSTQLYDLAAELLAVCNDCPAAEMARCAAWAERERYDGVAGGAVYRDGQLLRRRKETAA